MPIKPVSGPTAGRMLSVSAVSNCSASGNGLPGIFSGFDWGARVAQFAAQLRAANNEWQQHNLLIGIRWWNLPDTWIVRRAFPACGLSPHEHRLPVYSMSIFILFRVREIGFQDALGGHRIERRLETRAVHARRAQGTLGGIPGQVL